MGKINYTLLNASVLNASRLNMTGETGKPGGGAGGYWPAGTPAAIRGSSVLWYDIAKQGATNESMAEHPYLKDLTGNGHDMELRNFAWTEESGISTVNYPGALVSDGVDDYAYVEGLPLLDDFTFITKRTINAQKNNSVGALKGESDSGNINNAFGLDVINRTGAYYYTSFGEPNLNPGNGTLGNAEIIVGTPSKINGFAVKRGSIADNFPYLWLMGYLPGARFAEEQLYTFLLFDRTLTDEEIEWVKNNLIENNTEI